MLLHLGGALLAPKATSRNIISMSILIKKNVYNAKIGFSVLVYTRFARYRFYVLSAIST